jgi:flagellar motor protein MotB
VARKEIEEEPKEDIPPWFMTFSDVITLLMTFFILLLTFATTEPERLEKVSVNFFGSSGSTGVAGHDLEQLDRDSWSQRVRPRSARIAMRGAEMPPIVKDTARAAVGSGLEAISEETAKKDVMKSHAFVLPLNDVINRNGNLTDKGVQLAAKLSEQLQALNIHCALETADRSAGDRLSAFAHHLYHVQRARPGQVSVGIVDNLDSTMMRLVIERYEESR